MGSLIGSNFASGRIKLISCVAVTMSTIALVLPNVSAQWRRRPPDDSYFRAQRAGAGLEARVDRVVTNLMQEQQTPGVMVAVVRNGRVVLEKGYGVKSLPAGPAPDQDTVFYIGSLSKALTAFGAMLLVDQGRFSLDDAASRYIPDLPAQWRRITIRQFMSHTSGIPEIPERTRRGEPSIHEVFQRAANLPMSFEPGARQQYNNFNYAIIGHLIEVISGTPYMEYMRRRVFGPLHMDHTGVGYQGDNVATGYELVRGQLVAGKPDIARFGWPSGGLESTVADLLKFEEAIRTHQLMKDSTFRLMLERVGAGNATPGWFERDAGGVRVFSKNGAVTGYTSMLQFVPERGDAVIVLRNIKGKGVGVGRTSNQILNVCCGIPVRGGRMTEEDDGSGGA